MDNVPLLAQQSGYGEKHGVMARGAARQPDEVGSRGARTAKQAPRLVLPEQIAGHDVGGAGWALVGSHSAVASISWRRLARARWM